MDLCPPAFYQFEITAAGIGHNDISHGMTSENPFYSDTISHYISKLHETLVPLVSLVDIMILYSFWSPKREFYQEHLN